MPGNPWGLHAEPFDRIRAAENRHPDHFVLRGGRLLAQRLAVLGPPAGREPDLGGRRRLGEPVQGDAQSAHRPLHHQPAAQFRCADGSGHRKISAQHSRHRDARHEQRAHDAWQHGVRPAEDAGAGVRAPAQGGRRHAEGILGSDGQAEGAAPPDAGQGIHGYGNDAARRARQAVGVSRGHRQPSGRHHRSVAGDQADRLAAPQHRRARPR